MSLEGHYARSHTHRAGEKSGKDRSAGAAAAATSVGGEGEADRRFPEGLAASLSLLSARVHSFLL